MARPTKAGLERLRSQLKRGEQHALGDGIYARVDGSGRLRFQVRIRTGGRGSPQLGATYDSWEEADRGRRKLLARKESGQGGDIARELARMPFEEFAKLWWEDHVLLHCDDLTQLDYGRVLETSLIPYFRGRTLASLGFEDGVAFQRWLRGQRVHRRGPRKGEVAISACDRALALLKRILNYGVLRGALPYNRCQGVGPLGTAKGKRSAGGNRVRRASRREIIVPTHVERIREEIRGRHEQTTQMYRALVSVLAYLGLRPGEAMALRHSDWRTPEGRRSHIHVAQAVKDVSGFLVLGPTKTRQARDVFLWSVVAEELEALYQKQGCPSLASLVFPSSSTEVAFMRFDNWRDRPWYQALHRAGFAAAPIPSAEGALDPYCLRHTCATLMLYAAKPGGGHYTINEVARQLGHSPTLTLEVYGHIMDDDSEIAGKTIEEAIRDARRGVSAPLTKDENPSVKALRA
ncbi:MAG: tyrosine-type recombinase/integrase [Gaiellaceae bacterium]